MALNYTTDEVPDYVLANGDADLSSEESESDSDEEICQNFSLNLDKECDILVNPGTVGLDLARQKVMVPSGAVVRKVRGRSRAGMVCPVSNKKYTKEWQN